MTSVTLNDEHIKYLNANIKKKDSSILNTNAVANDLMSMGIAGCKLTVAQFKTGIIEYISKTYDKDTSKRYIPGRDFIPGFVYDKDTSVEKPKEIVRQGRTTKRTEIQVRTRSSSVGREKRSDYSAMNVTEMNVPYELQYNLMTVNYTMDALSKEFDVFKDVNYRGIVIDIDHLYELQEINLLYSIMCSVDDYKCYRAEALTKSIMDSRVSYQIKARLLSHIEMYISNKLDKHPELMSDPSMGSLYTVVTNALNVLNAKVVDEIIGKLEEEYRCVKKFNDSITELMKLEAKFIKSLSSYKIQQPSLLKQFYGENRKIDTNGVPETSINMLNDVEHQLQLLKGKP